MLAGVIGLIVLYFVFTYVLFPVYSFIDWVPGGWVILGMMAVAGRIAYLKRDTDYMIDRTHGLRKLIEKVSKGRYVYCRTFW